MKIRIWKKKRNLIDLEIIKKCMTGILMCESIRWKMDAILDIQGNFPLTFSCAYDEFDEFKMLDIDFQLYNFD